MKNDRKIQIFEIFDHFGSRSTPRAPENSEQAPGDLMTVEKLNEEGTQPQSALEFRQRRADDQIHWLITLKVIVSF